MWRKLKYGSESWLRGFATLAVFVGLFVAGAAVAGESPTSIITTISGTTDTGTTSTATGSSAPTSTGTSTSAATTTVAPTSPPTISTDYADYAAGATVTLSGAGWASGEAVSIFVDDSTGHTWNYSTSTTAGSNGAFSVQFQISSSFVSNYIVTATGKISGTATTTFTDANLAFDLDQCQNISLAHLGDPCGIAPLTGGSGWQNGDVNGSNSQYREGDGLPYRTKVTTIGNGTFSMTFDYDFTKAGVFAIDRLTKWNLTQASSPCDDQIKVSCSGAPTDTFAMPFDVASPSATQPALPNGGNLFTWGAGFVPTTLSTIAGSGDMAVWADGGNFTFVSAGQNNTGSQATSFNDGKVQQNGSAAGDSDRQFVAKFTMTGCPASGCNLMFGWSGHIAAAADWGSGKGAASISGAPFHMRILGLDTTLGTSGGNQDRSVQLSAIVSTIQVKKVLIPSTDTGTFNLQIDGTTYATGGDGADTTPIAKSASSTGTSHTVGETGAGGTLLSNYTSSISCSNGASGTGTSLVISLFTGQNIVCTITNTRKATLKVDKICVPTTDPGRFNLRVDGANWGTGANAACGGTTGAVTVSTGLHTISETGGTDGTTTTVLANYDKVIGGDCAADGTITISSGQNAVCTITNSRLPTLKVDKICVPTTDLGRFNLRVDGANWGTGANAACGGTTGAVVTTVGTKTVSETGGTDGTTTTDLANYDKVIGGACTAAGSVTLAYGDTKTCTITNTRKGRVTLLKLENGATPTTVYTFELTGGPNSVDITKDTSSGNSLDFGLLSPGTYQLCELNVPAGTTPVLTAPSGYVMVLVDANTGKYCIDVSPASPPAQFTLAAAQVLAFTIDDQHPLGGQRTIGYWKNWNSCSHDSAFVARSLKTGNALADSFLPIILVPGAFPYAGVTVTTCAQVVDILSNASAKYAEHQLAAQLLAAMLNVAAGAGCGNINTVISHAQSLLQTIHWNGSSSTKIVDANSPYRADFLSTAATLDQFNNGLYC